MVSASVSPKGLLQSVALMAMVEELDGLLQPDCDKQADDNRCNVDEEAFPGVN
jgi:hypothetical protein